MLSIVKPDYQSITPVSSAMDSDCDMYDSDFADSDYADLSDQEPEIADFDDEEENQALKTAEKTAIPSENKKKNQFRVWDKEQIRQNQNTEIQNISSILSISRSQALILLRHYKWDGCKATEQWFSDEEKVRNLLGIFNNPTPKKSTKKTKKMVACEICYDEFHVKDLKRNVCGHQFCDECWGRYVSVAIKDGPGCLSLKCPQPKCNGAVDEDMVFSLKLEEEDLKEKYSNFVVRSFVEDRPKIKWCPSPGCDYAIECDSACDVLCKCCYVFCFNCTEEAHRPVDCETVRKWLIKNSAESENTTWILANSKPCPKCKRPIEKNHGCMHMTCSAPCKYEFCWLCLGDWKIHSDKTGGFYACNKYEIERKEGGTLAQEQRMREMAKASLEKYTHYYERWQSNDNSRKRALDDLAKLEPEIYEDLGQKVNKHVTEFDFITKAWQQIVNCRKVLKWTYAYGYYLAEEEQSPKKKLFEYLQGQAESGLERLHQCAEQDLQKFMKVEDGVEPFEGDFDVFQEKLLRLTAVTGSYFENLVQALENGLRDVYAA